MPWKGVTGQTSKTALGRGGGGAYIFSRITHYHKASLGLSHTGILCFEVAHIMNLNFLLLYFVELYRCEVQSLRSLRFVKKRVIWYEF